MSLPSKPCRVCGLDKSLTDYPVKSSRPDGRDTLCKQCVEDYRQRKAAKGSPSAPVPQPVVVDPTKLSTPETDFRPNLEVLATFAANVGMVQAGKLAPNMLWIGPSGSGKTEQARDLARRAKLPFYKIDAPAMTDPEAWFGTREVRVRDGAPETVVNDSQFVTAVQTPCVLLIDEGNRVADAIRQILLALWDDSRQVTNPLTGQPLVRHRECYIVMTANVGLAFTGTYAIDPAFYTRSVTTRFDYLDPEAETAVAISRTGVAPDVAALFVRFANETRERAKLNEDFPPISMREVLTASNLVAHGLDVTTAARVAMINAAPSEGGPESIQGQLEMIWTGIRERGTIDNDD